MQSVYKFHAMPAWKLRLYKFWRLHGFMMLVLFSFLGFMIFAAIPDPHMQQNFDRAQQLRAEQMAVFAKTWTVETSCELSRSRSFTFVGDYTLEELYEMFLKAMQMPDGRRVHYFGRDGFSCMAIWSRI